MTDPAHHSYLVDFENHAMVASFEKERFAGRCFAGLYDFSGLMTFVDVQCFPTARLGLWLGVFGLGLQK
jgi:hypothetical protein